MFTYTVFYSHSVTLMLIHPFLQRPHHLRHLLLLQRAANVGHATSFTTMVSATMFTYIQLLGYAHSKNIYVLLSSLCSCCTNCNCHYRTLYGFSVLFNIYLSSDFTYSNEFLHESYSSMLQSSQTWETLFSKHFLYQFIHAACENSISYEFEEG